MESAVVMKVLYKRSIGKNGLYYDLFIGNGESLSYRETWLAKITRPDVLSEKVKVKRSIVWNLFIWVMSRIVISFSYLYRMKGASMQSKSVDWFLYGRDLRHERVNALLLVCIHRDIFIDYDKIIDIYALKYPRRILLINPLSGN